jgi:hypothetical protein
MTRNLTDLILAQVLEDGDILEAYIDKDFNLKHYFDEKCSREKRTSSYYTQSYYTAYENTHYKIYETQELIPYVVFLKTKCYFFKKFSLLDGMTFLATNAEEALELACEENNSRMELII